MFEYQVRVYNFDWEEIQFFKLLTQYSSNGKQKRNALVIEKIKDKKIQYIDFDFNHFLKLHYSLIKI